MLEDLVGAMHPGRFRDHLTVVRGRPEGARIEWNGRDRLTLHRLGEFAHVDLRPLRHADLVDAIERRPVVGPRRLQFLHQVLGVAQIGEVRLGDHQNIVRADQHALGPRRPLVRHVEHDAGRRHAQGIEDRIEGFGAEVIDPLERRGRRQQMRGYRCIWRAGAPSTRCPAGRAGTPRWRCPATGPCCSRGRRSRTADRDR